MCYWRKLFKIANINHQDLLSAIKYSITTSFRENIYISPSFQHTACPKDISQYWNAFSSQFLINYFNFFLCEEKEKFLPPKLISNLATRWGHHYYSQAKLLILPTTTPLLLILYVLSICFMHNNKFCVTIHFCQNIILISKCVRATSWTTPKVPKLNTSVAVVVSLHKQI